MDKVRDECPTNIWYKIYQNSHFICERPELVPFFWSISLQFVLPEVNGLVSKLFPQILWEKTDSIKGNAFENPSNLYFQILIMPTAAVLCP